MIMKILLVIFVIIDFGYFLYKHIKSTKFDDLYIKEIIAISMSRTGILVGLLFLNGVWK